MNINSNGYVLGFAVGVCVVMSAMLAVTSMALKDTQNAAKEFDRRKNVMVAAALVDSDGHILPEKEKIAARPELEALFEKQIEEKVLVLATGEFDPKLTSREYGIMKPEERRKFSVVAIAKDAQGKIGSYVLPISGRGLWSEVKGYLALEPDGNTVKGVTFYEHGETPGLGGECENPEWTHKWVGKTILGDGDKLACIVVKKGQIDPQVPFENKHMVDGLSGATLTGKGITNFVKSDLENYKPFLSKIWKR